MSSEPEFRSDAVGGDGSESREAAPPPLRRGSRREASDELLVQALAEGLTQVAAGERAGVTERTVRRRLESPEFVACVPERRRQMVAESTGRVTALLSAAVDTLAELVRAGEPPIRLRAATAIIRTTADYQVSQDLAERISELEATVTEGTES